MIDGIDTREEMPRGNEGNLILSRFLRGSEPNNREYLSGLEKIIGEGNLKKDYKNPLEVSNILKTNFEEKIPLTIPLSRIDSSIIERPGVNERLDRFIGERIDWPVLFVDNLSVFSPKKSFFSPTGLRVYVTAAGAGHSRSVNGERVMLENYNVVEFTPEGLVHFDQSKMTQSLVNGIQGVVELIDAVDQGKFQAAPVFMGTTNINMALIAQRLGFVIVDECRTPDGNINKDLKSFIVIGKLEDIRARVEEFKKAGVGQKLGRRSQRLQVKSKLAPAGR